MIVVSYIVTTIMWREIQFTVTLKMTTCTIRGVETSVTVDISSIQDYTEPDNHIPHTYDMSSGLKPFTESCRFCYKILIIMPGNLLTGPQKFAFQYIIYFIFYFGMSTACSIFTILN